MTDEPAPKTPKPDRVKVTSKPLERPTVAKVMAHALLSLVTGEMVIHAEPVSADPLDGWVIRLVPPGMEERVEGDDHADGFDFEEAKGPAR